MVLQAIEICSYSGISISRHYSYLMDCYQCYGMTIDFAYMA